MDSVVEKLERDTRASCPLLKMNSSHLSHNTRHVSPSVSSSSNTSWQEIRIFVSSTFKDYHCEREILVHNIFPRLRDWCEKRNLLLAEVDLRWGVPAQSSSGTTLRACLGEIDRCSDVNNAPFFLNMLGHRYGWIPSSNDVPDDVRAAYQWIDNSSVTHMEIVHAAFRNSIRNPNALFLIRDSDFLTHLPPDILPDFIETNSQSQESLELLKSLIREVYSSTSQVINYCPRYHGIETQSTSLPKVCLTQMNHFCDSILEFFQNAIDQQYPRQPQLPHSQPQQLQQFQLFDLKITLFAQQERFLVQKTQRTLFGRDEEFCFLLEYATATSPFSEMEPLSVNPAPLSSSSLPFWIYGDRNLNLPILLFSPEPSSGKSSLLSRLFLQCQQLLPHSPIFFHSFQAHQDDLFLPNNLTLFLFRFCLEFGNETIHQKLATDLSRYPSLATFPHDHLTTIAHLIIQQTQDQETQDQSSSPLVIILDEIDFPYDFPQGLDVILRLFSPLPPQPSRFRIIFSSSHSHILTSYLRNFTTHISNLANILFLTSLPTSRLQLIVNNFFSVYNKQLDPSQLSLLLSHPSVTDLNWLAIACDTLRLFGAFETVNSYIQSLPLTTDELLLKYLTRIESLSHHLSSSSTGAAAAAGGGAGAGGEEERPYNLFSLYFQSTLHLLLASQSGLQESEIRILLNQIRVETETILLSRPPPQNLESKINDFTSAASVPWNDLYLSSPYARYASSPSSSTVHSFEPIPYIHWSVIYSFLKIFLKISSPFDLTTTSQFFHLPFKPRFILKSSHLQQLLRRYFHLTPSPSSTATPSSSSQHPKLKYYSLKLVQYFHSPHPPSTPPVSSPPCDLLRRREEYPYQLLSCQLYQLLQEYLFSDDWKYLSYPQQRYFMDAIRCKHSIHLPPTVTTATAAATIPSKEFMCLGCSMKSTRNKTLLNRQCCFLCGNGTHSIYFTTATQCTIQLNPSESFCYQCRLHHPRYYQQPSSFNQLPRPPAHAVLCPPAGLTNKLPLSPPHSTTHSLHSGGGTSSVQLECVFCKLPISGHSPALPVIQCHFCSLLGKGRCVHTEQKNKE
jgi:hypothetical protein